MTIINIDVVHTLHTCPGQAQPHIVDTVRTIAFITPGGPCRTPVTIRCGDTQTVLDCARHEPPHRQCQACRVAVHHRSVAYVQVSA